ncbi:hypothetical protein ACLKA6_012450 [Drosophila palustris]
MWQQDALTSITCVAALLTSGNGNGNGNGIRHNEAAKSNLNPLPATLHGRAPSKEAKKNPANSRNQAAKSPRPFHLPTQPPPRQWGDHGSWCRCQCWVPIESRTVLTAFPSFRHQL